MPDQLTTDLTQLPALAQKCFNDFEVMRYMLEINDELTDTQIDQWVESIALPIIQAIDCTQCANCCRALDVYVTETDAHRLSQHIDIHLNDIITHDSAQSDGEWGLFKHKPCVFLIGKQCSIYEHRPESCRIYPVFTPDFRWTLGDIIEGASLCPIIYNVLVRIEANLDSLYG